MTESKNTCWARRHLNKGSLFSTYDAMAAVAHGTDGDGFCYLNLWQLVNRTGVGYNQTRNNTKKLVSLGWAIPEAKVRFKRGQFQRNSYRMLTHEEYAARALKHESSYAACPPYLFNEQTGERLTAATPLATVSGLNTRFTAANPLATHRCQCTGLPLPARWQQSPNTVRT